MSRLHPPGAVRLLVLCLLAMLLAPAAASAEGRTTLLKTLNTTSGDGVDYPAVASAGGHTYFTANDGVHGNEPWVVTAGGAAMLADTTPDDGSISAAEPAGYTATGSGSDVYFTAGGRLWFTDGSPAGTHAVAGLPDGVPRLLRVTGDRLYVQLETFDPDTGSLRDAGYVMPVGGTGADAELLAVPDGQDDHAVLAFPDLGDVPAAVVNGTGGALLVTYDDGQPHSVRYDGQPVSVIAGAGSRIGDELYFWGTTPTMGIVLFVSDGTDAGTTPVTIDGGEPIPFSGTDAIVAGPGGDALAVSLSSIWRIDGASASAAGRVSGGVYWMTYGAGHLVTVGSSGVVSNDLEAPSADGVTLSDVGDEFVVASGDRVYFSTAAGTEEGRIWGTDGTPAGTYVVADASVMARPTPFHGPYARPGGGIYFSAVHPQLGAELYASTGLPGAKASVVVDANTNTDASFYGAGFGATLPDAALLSAGTLTAPWTSWFTDGTPEGTRLAAPELDAAQEPVAFGGGVVVKSFPTTGGSARLVFTDGTTTRVISGSIRVAVGPFVVGDQLYWTGETSNGIARLYRSGGGAQEPPQLVPLKGLTSSVVIQGATALGDHVIYDRADGVSVPNESGLWAYDPTTGVDQPIASSAGASFWVGDAVEAGGRLYVPAVDTATAELTVWSTDGTVAGSAELDIPQAATIYASGVQPVLRAIGGAVIAAVPSAESAGGAAASALLRFSGTTVTPIAGVDPIGAYAALGASVALGATRWLTTSKGLYAIGETGDPQLVKALTEAGPLTDVNGTLYFAARDAEHGRELWASDGTAEGTRMVSDLLPGAASGDPVAIQAAGTRVVFGATGPAAAGRQLYAYDPDAVVAVPSPVIVPSAEAPAPAAPNPTPAPTAAPSPTPAPTSVPLAGAARVRPANVSSTVRRVRKAPGGYAVRIEGTVLAAKGLRTKAACDGKLTIVLTARKGTLIVRRARLTTKVRWRGGACAYDATVKIGSRAKQRGTLVTAAVQYLGGTWLLPKSAKPLGVELG